MAGNGDEPDWKRYGLETQQPVTKPLLASDKYTDTDSDENELFKEERKGSADDDKPWWKANFFISEPVLFGAWDGVFTSCMLNIFGIIIFLRTGWMVGNAGVGLSIVIIFITLLVAVIGALSAIGICERCKIESGGVYFLLSHVLGGQIASAISILYCFGQAVSCSLYTVGFGESISEMLNTTGQPWVARGFAIGALLLLMSINLAGVKWVIRLQLILLFTIMVAAVDFLVGSFISFNMPAGVLRYSAHLLHNNTNPDYTTGQSFFSVFGVFFPTACGVLAGINMSGDLREPRKAIAQGTLAATALSGTFYVIFVLVLGSVTERWALQQDYMISEKISAIGVLWLIGLYVSSITSCMGCLYGAPRILQSIACSNNFSAPVSFLGMGRGPNKVPVVSLILIASISLLFICIGDVNFLAPIVTMPFLVTYIGVDYAYFALAMTADLKTADRPDSTSSPSSQSLVSKSNTQPDKLYGSVISPSEHTMTSTIPHSASQSESPAHSEKGELEKKDSSGLPAYKTDGNVQSTNRERGVEGPSEVSVINARDDLDELFPERQLEGGKTLIDQMSGHISSRSNGNEEIGGASSPDGIGDESINSEEQIHHMKASWYSKLCNRWSSLVGVLATFCIMFATQWLYSFVTWAAVVLLYIYMVYTIPGASPGIAKFSIVKWIKYKCNANKKRYLGQVIVNQHSPLLSTAPAQLNETNEDFSQRKPYHLSQLRSGQDLPLLCNSNDPAE